MSLIEKYIEGKETVIEGLGLNVTEVIELAVNTMNFINSEIKKKADLNQEFVMNTDIVMKKLIEYATTPEKCVAIGLIYQQITEIMNKRFGENSINRTNNEKTKYYPINGNMMGDA